MRPIKIYLASSWRNHAQKLLVEALRSWGYIVYDFKNPPGRSGFSWQQIDPDWHGENCEFEEFRERLAHPIAQAGFKSDMDALRDCDVCVLFLPCGKSAHLELGYAVGTGKRTIVLAIGEETPELMYLMCDRIVTSFTELSGELAEFAESTATHG